MNPQEIAQTQAACLFAHALTNNLQAYDEQLERLDNPYYVAHELVRMLCRTIQPEDAQEFAEKLLFIVATGPLTDI